MVQAKGRPQVSVAIAAWGGEETLRACLGSLRGQCATAEVVVAVNGSAESARREFTFARIIEAGPEADVFRLRTIAAEAATGRLIAVTEDHATFAPLWIESLKAAHAAGHGVVGGPVDNGLTRRAFDWALYFCEYGLHMPPVAGGPVEVVSGVNVAFDRELLMSCRELWRKTLHENEINDALRHRGVKLHMVPAAVVWAHLPMGLRGAMAHLYGGGHQYGRYRCTQAGPLGRFAWVVLSPLVPFVLLARIGRRIAARNPRRLWQMLRGLPYFALVLGAWSLGEAWGYVRGAPRGES